VRHLTVQQLSASLDGALVGVSLELVVRHLATCHECRDRHARLSKQDDTLRRLLAWDPGAEYFEDASIRLETILDAESRGVAPPRVAEIEAHLPRVTLDEVMRSATSPSPPAPVPAPAPAPAPTPPAAEQPAMQFPDWMQRSEPATPRPAAPAPVPRAQRPPTLRVERVELPREEHTAIVPEPAPAPETVEAPAQAGPQVPPAPRITAAPAPAPTPTTTAVTPQWPLPAPRPTLALAPEPAPLTLATPRPEPAPARAAHRVALPRWVTPLAATAAGIALFLAVLSALPPVIRIPAPELPRFPRIELVKRQPRPMVASTPAAFAHAQAPDTLATSIRTQTPLQSALVEFVTPAQESPVEPARMEPPHPVQTPVRAPVQAQAQVPRLPRQAPLPTPTTVERTPAPITPAPVRAATPTPSVTQPTASPSGDSQADAAADWPLLCGEVLDDTGTPVAGARVMLADLELSARTDKRGRFCIAAPPGDRTLSVAAMGFGTARQVVSLDNQTLEVRIALRPTP